MNAARNHDRPMLGRSHPAIDALESRIQANVTVSRMGNGYVIEAKGFAKAGSGTTIPRAVAIFLFHNRLES